jgi:hypothetical protein
LKAHLAQYKHLESLAIAALLITFFGFFAVKVWDIDFWWHIAAGKNTLENLAIPNADPFGVYDANNIWGQTVLKSQWLGQVLLYAVHRSFGIDGIILFRAAILTLCLFIVYLRCRIHATPNLFSLGITALVGMVILHFTGDRPQLFSFLYLSLIFLLLDAYLRYNRRWLLYCVPAIMLLWSNTHGGAMLGAALLGLLGCAYTLENWLITKRSRPIIQHTLNFSGYLPKLALIIVALSVTTLLLTPNGLTTLKYLLFLENSPIQGRVSEYAPPWELWEATRYYWAFLVVTVVSLLGLFKPIYLKQFILVLVIALISLTAYRYIPFFALLAAPYVAASLGRMLRRIKPPENIINIAAIIIAISFLAYGYKQNQVFQYGVVAQRYPIGAVKFIQQNMLGGKIFNTMNWGGYLIWNLGKTATVYIDGRMLDPKRVLLYTNILWATKGGKQLLEQGDFDLVLLPYGNSISGEKYPIVNYLAKHPGWQLIYQDRSGVLFSKIPRLHLD